MSKPAALLVLLLTACAPPYRAELPPSPAPDVPTAEGRVGLLVMAHGGDPEWNRTVHDAVAPLRAQLPTVVAFGMANPRTLATALDSLRMSGVDRVALVRMFLSGASFRQQTAYLLGMSATPPEQFVLMGMGAPMEDPRPIDHGLTVVTHRDGLMLSPQARAIVHERAMGLSVSPTDESVLLLAHGMGDDTENHDVVRAMEAMAEPIAMAGFAKVEVATLREDWADKRAPAEDRIRAFVGSEAAAGRRTIVLPIRLSGFGPYAEVLAGLDYTPAQGLLPHREISEWIRATASQIVCSSGWGEAVGPCPNRMVQPPSPMR